MGIKRMYDPEQGSITSAERDVKDYTFDSLHSGVVMVEQEPSMFARSVLENITYGMPADSWTMESVREACRQSGALAFIEKLAKKFDTEVGERGVKLSGGEKQRVAIARALV